MSQVIREELTNYLRQNYRLLVLPTPLGVTGAERQWFNSVKHVGRSINEIVDELYQRLIDSGRAITREIAVTDSTIMNAYEAYIPLRIKTAIMQEIQVLIETGVFIPVRYLPEDEGRNFNFKLQYPSESLILTPFGAQFIAQSYPSPYFVDEYFSHLCRFSEPDEVLKTYLLEGLNCVRMRLSRAAAILLRLSIEHVLNQLIVSTKAAITDNSERGQFTSRVDRAKTNIEERAEVVFRKLESSAALLPTSDHLNNAVKNQLRAAFHSIRTLGGRAAHLSSPVELAEVVDHYTLFAGSVYSIAVKVMEYHDSIKTSAPS